MKELVVSKSKMSLMVFVNNGDKIQVLMTKPEYSKEFIRAFLRIENGENLVQIDLDGYETDKDKGREKG